VFLNDKPVSLRAVPINIFTVRELEASIPNTGIILKVGQGKEIYILVDDSYESLSSGTTVNIKLHSAGGMARAPY
jgi:hypothetical protein